MDRSYGDWKAGSNGTGVEFQELESLRRLKALDITIQTDSALQKLSQSHQLAGSTRVLDVNGCTGLQTIQLPSSDLWKKMTGLMTLWISNCVNLEDVIISGSGGDDELPVLSSLQSLFLQGLQRARIVWKDGCVQHLTYLTIWYCNKIEKLIETPSEEEECRTISVFPNLRGLYLYSLPKFKSLNNGRTLFGFPSLEILEVVGCPKLKTLKFSSEKLKEIKCTSEWWDGLEWDDDDHKQWCWN